jgi:hypothetical protein
MNCSSAIQTLTSILRPITDLKASPIEIARPAFDPEDLR